MDIFVHIFQSRVPNLDLFVKVGLVGFDFDAPFICPTVPEALLANIEEGLKLSLGVTEAEGAVKYGHWRELQVLVRYRLPHWRICDHDIFFQFFAGLYNLLLDRFSQRLNRLRLRLEVGLDALGLIIKELIDISEVVLDGGP